MVWLFMFRAAETSLEEEPFFLWLSFRDAISTSGVWLVARGATEGSACLGTGVATTVAAAAAGKGWGLQGEGVRPMGNEEASLFAEDTTCVDWMLLSFSKSSLDHWLCSLPLHSSKQVHTMRFVSCEFVTDESNLKNFKPLLQPKLNE